MSAVRRISVIVGAVALVAVIWYWPHPAAPPRRDPGLNVLLITIDTLRADALGSYGNARAATPWMDRLAAGGARFTSAHAQTVMTLPSHANMLSGVYPQDHGVRDNAGFRFPVARPTLATLLKARGYATGAFISAFPLDARFGLARGFDVYDDSFVDAVPRPPLLEQERRGIETAGLARRWLDSHAGARTFCWVHVYEPHAPYLPPEPIASRFRMDPYAGEVAAADAALEPLLRPILDAGSAARTLVVLTGDHGEALGEHGEATHGVFAYESTLRVPLIVYAPGLIAPHVESSEARHVDIVPSILDALDIAPPDGLRGRTLLAAARARDEPVSTYFESLSPALNRGWAPLRGIVRDGLKYIDLPLPELYDLAADPAEAHNLIDTRAADARALRDQLSAFGAAPPDGSRIVESADARARLESLGYASSGVAGRSQYSADDDPKRLIGLDARLQNAVRLYTSGDRRGALVEAESLVRQRPDMRVAWITLAQIQRDEGALDRAIESARRAYALAPRDPQTAALAGTYLTERGSAVDAVALLTPLAAGDTADLQVLVALGLAQARAGRRAEAIATLERARTAYPENAMLLVDIGTVQLMDNQRDAARRAFEAAIARNPGLARAHSSLAAMHAEEGRPDDAIARWREATRIDPSEYGRIFLLGVSFARAGRTAPARACLTFFAENAPADDYAQQIATARQWLGRSR
jgi:predicted Zn-dependent protease